MIITFEKIPTNLRILFVDDDRIRYMNFIRTQRPQDTVIWAKTYFDAEKKIIGNFFLNFDIIFLDNDLGDTETEMEGKDFVHKICKNGVEVQDHTVFVIHSMNSVENKKMAEELTHNGYSAVSAAGAWKNSYQVSGNKFAFQCGI